MAKPDTLAPVGLSRGELLAALAMSRPLGVADREWAREAGAAEIAKARQWSNAVFWIGNALHGAEGPLVVEKFCEDARKA